MSKLLEILANKDLADTQEIKIGEETYNLGDLRAVNAERETFRTERDTIARERDDFRGKHDTLASTVTDLLSKVGKAAENETEHPPVDPKESLREALRPLLEKDDPAKALWEDKVFGTALNTAEERGYQRAKKDIDALAAKFDGLNTKLDQGFEGMTRAQISERAERWYSDNRNDIPKGEDGKRLSLKAIHEYGAQRNMVRADAPNLVDYDRVLETLTEPTRVEARIKEASDKAYQKGIEAGRRGAAEVIPLFGDRSAGGAVAEKPNTAGMSTRQIMEGAIARGLAREAGNE